MSASVSKLPRSTRFPLTPARVNRLTLLTLVIFVAGLLRGIALLIAENETAVIIDGQEFMPPPVPIPALLVAAGILAAIYAVVVFGLRRRREWSRTLGTIITGSAVLGAAASAIGLGNPITTLLVLANVFVVGAGIAWIYVAWWNPSRPR